MPFAVTLPPQAKLAALKLQPLLMLVGVSLLAWYAAAAYWAYYSYKQPMPITGPVISSENYAYKLPNLVLFDQALSAPTGSGNVDFSALALTLEGVFVNKGSLSAALIRSNNISKKYRIGQLIEGTSVQLDEVRWNEVILASSDKTSRASLKLGESVAKPIEAALPASNNFASSNLPGGTLPMGLGGQPATGLADFNPQSAQQNIGAALAQVAQSFNSNPQQTLSSMGISATSKGYAVTQASGLTTMGILPGDTVTSVNGQAVGPDLRQDQKLLQAVINARQATIQVVRSGQTITINQSW